MKKEHWFVAALVLALLVTIFIQSQSLFVYPCPDTAMWLGDESWKMLAARGLFQTGHPVLPEAIGSTLAKGTGLVSGSSWITTTFYGLPASLTNANPVDVGRVVTLILSLVFLITFYYIVVKEGVAKITVLGGLLILVISTFFVIESHSARSDLITGFAIIGLLFLLHHFYRHPSQRGFFITALAWSASPLVYIHVITLTSFSYAFFLYKSKVWRSGIWASLFGLLVGALLVLVPYLITTGSIQLFGPTSGKHVQYNDVVNSLPIMHLTSPSVLKATLLARLSHWFELGLPLMTLVLLSSIAYLALGLKAQNGILLSLSIMVIASSFFVQGDAVFYMVHIGPTLLLIALLQLQNLSTLPSPRVVSAFGILVAIIGNIYFVNQATKGRLLVERNQSLISSLLNPIHSTSKPLVVTDQASTYYALSDTNVRIMTNHFLYFPSSDYATTLETAKPDYMLLYPLSDYIKTFAIEHGTLVNEKSDVLSELKVFVEQSSKPDTVALYRYAVLP